MAAWCRRQAQYRSRNLKLILTAEDAGIRCQNVRGAGAVMQQIEDWLKTLDMSEYAGRFAELRLTSASSPISQTKI
jgi:hypothetical protein